MNSKLTLKLNSEVIARAKSYAKKRNTSLSKMIESYLITGRIILITWIKNIHETAAY
jgi:hypothetical protein